MRKINAQLKKFLLYTAGFLVFGLIMIYSATSVTAQQPPINDAYHFVKYQLVWILAGSILGYIFYRLPREPLKKLSLVLFVSSAFLLVLLGAVSLGVKCKSENDFSIPFAKCNHWARRWVTLNPSPLPKFPIIGEISFQPTELSKIAFILFLAGVLQKLAAQKSKRTFIYFMLITGFLSGLILIQPNMSNAVLVFCIGISMYFVSGASIKPFLVLMPLAVLIFAIFLIATPWRRERLETLITGKSDSDTSMTTSYQSRQISIALGSGGIFGLGLGQSKAKYGYVPEIYADSIFAIIGEEFGFVGAATILILFANYFVFCYKIVNSTHDAFDKLVSCGVTTWLFLQFAVNISAMAHIIPITGVPLTFISYGGSSMVFTLASVGLFAGVVRRNP